VVEELKGSYDTIIYYDTMIYAATGATTGARYSNWIVFYFYVLSTIIDIITCDINIYVSIVCSSILLFVSSFSLYLLLWEE
jgi:hypothetical protein